MSLAGRCLPLSLAAVLLTDDNTLAAHAHLNVISVSGARKKVAISMGSNRNVICWPARLRVKWLRCCEYQTWCLVRTRHISFLRLSEALSEGITRERVDPDACRSTPALYLLSLCFNLKTCSRPSHLLPAHVQERHSQTPKCDYISCGWMITSNIVMISDQLKRIYS